MPLQFLGSGAAYAPRLGSTGAFLRCGDDLVLLDCGESVFARAKALRLLENAGAVTVLVTHFHTDHIGSLPSLLSYLCHVQGRRGRVVFPQSSLWQLLQMLGVGPSEYEPCTAQELAAAPGIEARAISVRHVQDMECFGYLLKAEGKTMWYSGDAAEMPASILQMLREKRLAAACQDMTWERGVHQSHGSLESLAQQIPANLRPLVYGMHFAENFTSAAKRAGFKTVRNMGEKNG